MNIHLLDLFTKQFTAEVAGKVRHGLGINIADEKVASYCVKSAYELTHELPEFYLEEKNHSLLGELVAYSPDVSTKNIFDDVDLRTSEILRNGKYLVQAIYGVKHLNFLKKIKEPFELNKEQANNLWYISGSIILILIHSLTNNEDSLADLLSLIKREIEASKPRKYSSSFMSLLSF